MSRTTTRCEYRVTYRRMFCEHRQSKIFQRRADAVKLVGILLSTDSIRTWGGFAELRIESRPIVADWTVEQDLVEPGWRT